MSKTFNKIQWEDDDHDLLPEKDKKPDTTEFESMLATSNVEVHSYRSGQKVEGSIISIGESDQVLVELDPQNTGVLEKQQILDDDGPPPSWAPHDECERSPRGHRSSAASR